MKFCRDCIYSTLPEGHAASPDTQKCRHKSATIYSRYLVTGSIRDLTFQHCSFMRGPGSPCGPTGDLWEPAPSAGPHVSHEAPLERDPLAPSDYPTVGETLTDEGFDS